jgi:hypothetical protein
MLMHCYWRITFRRRSGLLSATKLPSYENSVIYNAANKTTLTSTNSK